MSEASEQREFLTLGFPADAAPRVLAAIAGLATHSDVEILYNSVDGPIYNPILVRPFVDHTTGEVVHLITADSLETHAETVGFHRTLGTRTFNAVYRHLQGGRHEQGVGKTGVVGLDASRLPNTLAWLKTPRGSITNSGAKGIELVQIVVDQLYDRPDDLDT